MLAVANLLLAAGGPSPNQPHTPTSFCAPPRSLPGLVVLDSHEDVLPDAGPDHPGLLGDIGQASMHPHQALLQVHLQQSEANLRTGLGQGQTPPGSAATAPRAPLPSGTLGALLYQWDFELGPARPTREMRKDLRTQKQWELSRPVGAVAETTVCNEDTMQFFSSFPSPCPSKQCLHALHGEMESSRPPLTIPGYHRIISNAVRFDNAIVVRWKNVLIFWTSR